MRLKISAMFVVFGFVLLMMPVRAQLKETYEPPGYLLEWGSYGSGDGQFAVPHGVGVSASGDVYVVDVFNDRIQKFDSAGNFLNQWGSSGTGDGQFDNPRGVAVDASGNVYVADTDNDRIQKFDSAGNFLTKWGSNGSGDGQFINPYGVAADDFGNVYVADANNARVQKFDSAGSFLTKWGSYGSSDGQFNYPRSVAVDAFGNVYVADTSNDRIQKFDSVGSFLTKWGTNGSGDSQFADPYGVAVDSSGNVYVVELDNDRIQKFDSAGNFLLKWGIDGFDGGQFRGPQGVVLDSYGNAYVADSGNHRIQKFAPALWFDLAGYDSYLSVAALHETTAVRTLFQLENNGAPRFAFENASSGVEWSFQQSGPGNFLISKEGTGGPEMQVYQNGRVRMGPAGAASFDLAPNGNLTIKGSLTANGGIFPDYVFEPGYELMQLDDVAEFIERERRLPGIPSADEVKQQGGHNMMELQLKLLEKVEEMTLYTLGHGHRLRDNDNEIEQLKARVRQIKGTLALAQ